MEKQLPRIVIKGTLQELIEIEAVLAHYYNVPDEIWNNSMTRFDYGLNADTNHILLNPSGKIHYHNHNCECTPYLVSDLNKILELIES